MNDKAITDKIWDVISNLEALEVSKAYVGESGTQFMQSEETVMLSDAVMPSLGLKPIASAAAQYFYKPMTMGGKTAVLAMNSAAASATLKIDFSKVPGLKGTKFKVRDVWAHKDLGTMTGSWSGSVVSHDSAFLILTPA